MSDVETARFDFFISYNHRDQPWAEWIAWRLEAAGYKTRIQAWDFAVGSNFVLEMHKAAARADRTIAVLSPNYLESSFTAPEWAAAFGNDPTGEKRLLIPVRVEKCELNGLLGSIVYLDFVDKPENDCVKGLLAVVGAERTKPDQAPTFPGPQSMSSDRLLRTPAFPGQKVSIQDHLSDAENSGGKLQREIEDDVLVASFPQSVGTTAKKVNTKFYQLQTPSFDGICLSGGGLRATLFQLGVFVHLFLCGKLGNVQLVVSVSGGSIIAAHFVKHWKSALKDRDGFIDIGSRLIGFTQKNVRNSVFIPWIWSRLCPINWIRWNSSRSARLRSVYDGHFGETTFGDLDAIPQIAIIATDSKKQQRVVFTNKGILRLGFSGKLGEPLLSKGVQLSLAVATSSCFPPVFSRYKLNYKHLNLKYSEFMETLKVNDGGVSGNLGVEATDALCKSIMPIKSIMFVDAECGQATGPRSVTSDLNAQGAALSEGARRFVSISIPESCLVQFSKRVDDKRGLEFSAETAIGGYRTDLDKPTWSEIYALMIQGEASCSQSLKARTPSMLVDGQKARDLIKEILVKAGAPDDIEIPTATTLRRCNRRPMGWVCLNVLAALVVGWLIWKVGRDYIVPNALQLCSFVSNKFFPSDKDVIREIESSFSAKTHEKDRIQSILISNDQPVEINIAKLTKLLEQLRLRHELIIERGVVTSNLDFCRVTGMCSLSLSEVRFARGHVLNLANIPSVQHLKIENANLQSIVGGNNKIGELQVAGCDELEGIVLSGIPKLRRLSMSECARIKTLELDQPKAVLQVLEMDRLPLVECKGLESQIELRVLRVLGCPKMMVQGQFQELSQLEFEGRLEQLGGMNTRKGKRSLRTWLHDNKKQFEQIERQASPRHVILESGDWNAKFLADAIHGN